MLMNSASLLTPAYDIDTPGSPDCGTGVEMILMAQVGPVRVVVALPGRRSPPVGSSVG